MNASPHINSNPAVLIAATVIKLKPNVTNARPIELTVTLTNGEYCWVGWKKPLGGYVLTTLQVGRPVSTSTFTIPSLQRR